MNHLVVGMNGIIGSALFNRLQSERANVWGTTYKPSDNQSDQTIFLNLADNPAQWKFPDVKFDVAYLCAGICRMALCENDPNGTSKVNIDGMIALIKHLSAQGTFIVYLSTNQVFSGQIPFVAENATYQPLNEYGRQKAVVEEWIKTNCSKWAIVRLTKVVEPNMQLIQDWINKLKQNETIDAFHDMMLAPVSLRQVLNVLINIGHKQKTGYYQVSGAKDVSYYDLATYLATKLECPISNINSVSALDKGIKKSFLPLFTTLTCSSTIALCDEKPPQFDEVVQECFDNL